MGIYKDILDKKATIAVIGLGYVGLPIALAFAKKVKVIGFDPRGKVKLSMRVVNQENGEDLGIEVTMPANTEKRTFNKNSKPAGNNTNKRPASTAAREKSENHRSPAEPAKSEKRKYFD